MNDEARADIATRFQAGNTVRLAHGATSEGHIRPVARTHRRRLLRQLGISARTVQRRVSALMARAQVSTRFALGHEAARRGWFGV